MREVAVEQLKQAPEDEVWLIADSSDLRKPYAEVMPYLMQVRDLDEQLVPGYRTLNVIGVTLGRRGLLSRRLFSSQAYDFVSEPAEGIIRIFGAQQYKSDENPSHRYKSESIRAFRGG